MMQWIDIFAAPSLALLLIAAVGGFFVHQRLGLKPVSSGAPGSAWRWLALGGVAALAMIAMTWSVAQGMTSSTAQDGAGVDWLVLDHQVQVWVQSLGQAAWMPVVRAWTQLGHVLWMAALGMLACVWLLYRRAWLLLGAWVVGVAGVGLLVRILKTQVARDRPEVRWAMEHGYSFPSGHSAGTLVCYGLLAWVWLTLARPAQPRWVVAGTVVTVLGVGVSRVLLGVHFVSDVLAGWLLGLAWLALVIGMAEMACKAAWTRQNRFLA